MSKTPSRDLRSRAASRREIALRAVLELSDRDASRIVYAPNAPVKDGVLEGTLIDASEGGLGVICEVFVPRWTHLRVRVMSPVDSGRRLCEAPCVARRVQMVDRRPAYLLGLGLDDPTEEQMDQLRALLAALDGLA